MCYFLTATLPKDADMTRVKPIIERCNMGFLPLPNAPVLPQLPAGELYFIATKAYCDCDTALGSELQTENRDLPNKSEIKKLRKKGWGQVKIDKWLAEKEQNQEAERLERRKMREQEVQNWLDFFKEMLGRGKVSHVGIIKHLYNGNIEDERFTIRETVSTKVTQVSKDYLLKLNEDILYRFSL